LINLAISVIVTYQIVQILTTTASDDQYEYISAQYVTDIVRNDPTKQTKYYPAILTEDFKAVLIAPTPISKSWAISMVQAGGSLYTFYQNNASQIIRDANYTPTDNQIHITGYGVFMYHYHPLVNHNCHSFWGIPIVKL
jgi:hypothetical protein